MRVKALGPRRLHTTEQRTGLLYAHDPRRKVFSTSRGATLQGRANRILHLYNSIICSLKEGGRSQLAWLSAKDNYAAEYP